MKTIFTLLTLLMCSIFSSAALAQTCNVSGTEAMTIALRQFQGKNVDDFILQDSKQTAWIFFVDAKKYDYLHLGNIMKSSSDRNISLLQKSNEYDAANNIDNLPRNARVRKLTRSDVKFKDVSLSQPGTLASALGDEINEIDSLVVRGPINEEDLHTIWSSSFYGGLTVANLEYAQIAGNRIPKNTSHCRMRRT